MRRQCFTLGARLSQRLFRLSGEVACAVTLELTVNVVSCLLSTVSIDAALFKWRNDIAVLREFGIFGNVLLAVLNHSSGLWISDDIFLLPSVSVGKKRIEQVTISAYRGCWQKVVSRSTSVVFVCLRDISSILNCTWYRACAIAARHRYIPAWLPAIISAREAGNAVSFHDALLIPCSVIETPHRWLTALSTGWVCLEIKIPRVALKSGRYKEVFAVAQFRS